MGLLDKLKFQLWDDVGAVVDLIAKWRPHGCAISVNSASTRIGTAASFFFSPERQSPICGKS